MLGCLQETLSMIQQVNMLSYRVEKFSSAFLFGDIVFGRRTSVLYLHCKIFETVSVWFILFNELLLCEVLVHVLDKTPFQFESILCFELKFP